VLDEVDGLSSSFASYTSVFSGYDDEAAHFSSAAFCSVVSEDSSAFFASIAFIP
jgi:hypothetical protein